MTLELRSDSFEDGDYLSADHVLSEQYGFGCAGGNVSPALAWSGAPNGTKSFALTCFDPDAPTGSGFWHWIVVNISPGVNHLPAGAGGDGELPAGALPVRTDYGAPGYGGPCPPEGDHPHRDIFTVDAVGLDALPVEADTSAAVVGFYLHFNTLEKATLMGLYKR
jgi:Raf kinase inhibitor-like YbhB/YbcL family protein